MFSKVSGLTNFDDPPLKIPVTTKHHLNEYKKPAIYTTQTMTVNVFCVTIFLFTIQHNNKTNTQFFKSGHVITVIS